MFVAMFGARVFGVCRHRNGYYQYFTDQSTAGAESFLQRLAIITAVLLGIGEPFWRLQAEAQGVWRGLGSVSFCQL